MKSSDRIRYYRTTAIVLGIVLTAFVFAPAEYSQYLIVVIVVFILIAGLFKRINFRQADTKLSNIRTFALRGRLTFSPDEVFLRDHLLQEFDDIFHHPDDIEDHEKREQLNEFKQQYTAEIVEKSFRYFILQRQYHLSPEESAILSWARNNKVDDAVIRFLKVFVRLLLLVVIGLSLFALYHFRSRGLL